MTNARCVAIVAFLLGLLSLLVASLVSTADYMIPLVLLGVVALFVSLASAISSRKYMLSKVVLVGALLLSIWITVTVVIYFVVGKPSL